MTDSSSVVSELHDVRVSPSAARLSDRVLPTWFVAGLAATIVGVATAGAGAVVLLMADVYVPAVAFTAALLAAAATAYGATRRLGRRPVSPTPAIIAIVLAAGFLALAAGFHSEHLLTDRDPGVYVNEGRSIARTHELDPLVRSGPFADRSYVVTAPGFGETSRGRLSMNFFPMLPALLALGWSIGGDGGMLMVPAVLGTIGVLAAYALASRAIGSRYALGAVVLLVISPLQLWFSRDAYSELVVQIVVLGGLWLYLEARARRRTGFAALAGAVIGSAVFARVDVFTIVLGLVVFAGVEWVRCDDGVEPARCRRVVVAFAGSLLATTGIVYGLMYGVRREYIDSFTDEIRLVEVLIVLALAGVVAGAVVHRVRPGTGRALAARKDVFALLVLIGAAAFVWAYVWRPDPARDLQQLAPGQLPTAQWRDSTNQWHWSRSLHWFASYFGLIAVIAAFLGLVVLGWLAVRGRRGATAVVLLVTPVTIAYIARPSIAPDQPWAMRRFLPVVLPGIAIAAAAFVAALWSTLSRTRRLAVKTVAGVGVVALALAISAPSAVGSAAFRDARMQDGAQAAVRELCSATGHDSAILVYGYGTLALVLPQTLRGYCGVPVAQPRTYGDFDIGALATAWHRLGRRLMVVTSSPGAVLNAARGHAKVVTHVEIADEHEPERVMDHRPQRSAPRPLAAWLLEVSPVEGTTAPQQ